MKVVLSPLKVAKVRLASRGAGKIAKITKSCVRERDEQESKNACAQRKDCKWGECTTNAPAWDCTAGAEANGAGAPRGLKSPKSAVGAARGAETVGMGSPSRSISPALEAGAGAGAETEAGAGLEEVVEGLLDGTLSYLCKSEKKRKEILK